MQGSTSGIPVNFAFRPTSADPKRSYYVVGDFNPDGIRNPSELCKATSKLKSQPVENSITTLMGAFCSFDSYLSHALSHSADVNGVNSEQLDALVIQLTLELFPPQNSQTAHRLWSTDQTIIHRAASAGAAQWPLAGVPLSRDDRCLR